MKLHLLYVELMLWFSGFRVQNSKDFQRVKMVCDNCCTFITLQSVNEAADKVRCEMIGGNPPVAILVLFCTALLATSSDSPFDLHQI
jgi:competence transcription factor ComK